ncbi:MAG: response regulator transcription factor [Anaerolineae bacterium]|nr:response regulator transcription factor [Anaerolineae bacterium]
MSGIRVLLVSDAPALQIGLRTLLEQAPDIEIAGIAESGREALGQLDTLQPDVLILNCQLPDMSRAETLAAIQAKGAPSRVLALSACSDKRCLRQMLEGGAAGYLLHADTQEMLAAAVQALAQGKEWFSPGVMDRIADWARDERQQIGPLTAREMDVLRLLVEGKTNHEIGRALAISEKTVEKHVADIFAKLGVASRVEAAVRAVRTGLV